MDGYRGGCAFVAGDGVGHGRSSPPGVLGCPNRDYFGGDNFLRGGVDLACSIRVADTRTNNSRLRIRGRLIGRSIGSAALGKYERKSYYRAGGSDSGQTCRDPREATTFLYSGWESSQSKYPKRYFSTGF